MARLFGTDGVRGVANEELTANLSYKLGLFGGEILSDGKKGQVLVGRDTRLSGEMLQAALSAGLMANGHDVIDLGIVSTPLIAYLCKEHGYRAGVVISASHNPYEYNGIKFFNNKGFKLKDEKEDEIEALIKKDDEKKALNGVEVGRIIDGKESVEEYIDYLKSIVRVDLKGVKIALDLGNGALYKIGPGVFEELGADVISINTKPDGRNINKNCGSTNPSMISDLVKKTGSFMGFSFDGDADRVIAVDEKGEIIDGDHMMAILATDMQKRGVLENKTVVGTVMSNMGLDVYLKSIGAKIVKTKVGDRYVLEEMLKNDYVIGGEQSGHIILLEHNTTGDGIATALNLLNVILSGDKKPSDLNKMVENFPQVLINAKVSNSKKYEYLENKRIKEEIEKLEDKFQKEGRVVIRPSGTEPKVRVMIEGKNLEEIKNAAEDLAAIIEKELA